ncbi:MAG: hypothetical protein H0W83_03325, partial [Planctomycetes bacterium]|nr:hypothetical protein [Planctomycetota bacterium]
MPFGTIDPSTLGQAMPPLPDDTKKNRAIIYPSIDGLVGMIQEARTKAPDHDETPK